jgi:FixJ family two-component response regulator
MTREPTVFVVDDNRSLRRSLQALLEAAGLPVETYASAGEFLERYDPRRPGCMVLDVRLRGSSGLDLQEELRRLRVPVPIIVLTAYADVPTSVRALETDRRARALAAQRDAIVDSIARLTPRERRIMICWRWATAPRRSPQR